MKIPKSFLKKTRVALIDFPLGGAFGIFHFKSNNKIIKELWQSINSPKCPSCKKGVLLASNESDLITSFKNKNDVTKLFCCTQCDYEISCPPHELNKKVYEHISFENNLSLSEDEYDNEIQGKVKALKWSSRFFFICAINFFGFAMYKLAFDGSLLTVLNTAALSLPLFASGIVRSYRCYQLKSKKFFIPGSFFEWLKHGKWFI